MISLNIIELLLKYYAVHSRRVSEEENRDIPEILFSWKILGEIITEPVIT